MTLCCPVCGSVLSTERLLDPKRVGYVCRCGHRFFMWSKPFGRRLPEPEKVRALPERTTDVEILRYWLTDPVARHELVDLLAPVCERLIEKLAGGASSRETTELEKRRDIAKTIVERLGDEGGVHRLIALCPTCGQPLSRYHEPREFYLDGYICAASHLTWYRNWILYFGQGDAHLEHWFYHTPARSGKPPTMPWGEMIADHRHEKSLYIHSYEPR